MKGLVISTRSFDQKKQNFLKSTFKKIEEVNGTRIENSEWRKISLPIYMLDLFSEVGVEVFEKLLLRTYHGTKLVESYYKFIKDISCLIVEEKEEQLIFESVYNEAASLRKELSFLIGRMADKEPYKCCFNALSETKRYTLDDLINIEESKFNCYECEVDETKYPFLPDYKCYILRSFNRKLSVALGKKYMQSIITLFGKDSDFLIHDYDHGKKLLRSSYRIPSTSIILFKHNKGDVYQILQEGSFSLLYLYVKHGFELKAKTQSLAVTIESKVMHNVGRLEKKYIEINEQIQIIKKEASKMIKADSRKITPSINKLEKCLGVGIYDNYSLCDIMFNLMKFNDYVLWENTDKE